MALSFSAGLSTIGKLLFMLFSFLDELFLVSIGISTAPVRVTVDFSRDSFYILNAFVETERQRMASSIVTSSFLFVKLLVLV